MITNDFASCIYHGSVRHRRFLPRPHEFTYSIFMMHLDLAELPHLFDNRWLWSVEDPAIAQFRRSDHSGDPEMDLASHVRDLVERESGKRPSGPIRMTTHLRYFGYIFNPVSFYYCMDANAERVETIVAEVTNTPWNETHCYVLHPGMNLGTGERMRFVFAKNFHVSPFMSMDQQYDWSFTQPGKKLAIYMESRENGQLMFDATMLMRRREISSGSLAGVLATYPLMTLKVITAIYWNAIRLRCKKNKFFAHPSQQNGTKEEVLP